MVGRVGDACARGGAVVAMLWVVACAEGVQDVGGQQLDEQPIGAQPLDEVDAGPPPAPMDDVAGEMSDAPAVPAGDPCSQGAVESCTCDDGGMGERVCQFDTSSPADGFFSECRSCQLPPMEEEPPPDPAEPEDPGTGAAGAAGAAGGGGAGGMAGSAGMGSAGMGDAGGSAPPPAPMPSTCSPSSCPSCPVLQGPCCTNAGQCGCGLLILNLITC